MHLPIPVYNQLINDVRKHMTNNEAYDTLDSEVCHESWYDNNDIYCVAKQFGNLYWENVI